MSGQGLQMVARLVWIVAISAMFAAMFKWIFPKVRHWVPIAIMAVLLPIISFVLTFIRMLIEIGLPTVVANSDPPGAIDDFASEFEMLIFVPLASALAALTSFVVLRVMAGRRAE